MTPFDPDGPFFISYRSVDGRDRANELDRMLQAAGIPVWRDERDLLHGEVRDRLQRALEGGLSGGVLIVTPRVVESDVVRNLEAPHLFRLAADPEFELAVANELEDPRHLGSPDLERMRTIFDIPSDASSPDFKQFPTFTAEGRRTLVDRILTDRLNHLLPATSSSRELTVHMHTRPTAEGVPLRGAHLDLRMEQSTTRTWPAREALLAWQEVLRSFTDCITNRQVTTLLFTGSMHISVALTLGLAFPLLRDYPAQLAYRDPSGVVWTSTGEPSPTRRDITVDLDAPRADAGSAADTGEAGPPILAAIVSLTSGADEPAFARFFDALPRPAAAAITISLTTGDWLTPGCEPDLTTEIACILKDRAGKLGAELHLLFHGPVALALMLGRRLNAVTVVLYEWDTTTWPNRYGAVLRVRAGTPTIIQEVLAPADEPGATTASAAASA